MASIQNKFKNLYAFSVVRADGSVVSWGHSGYGGDNAAVATLLTKVKSVYSNHGAFAALKSDGSVVTWGSSIYGGSSAIAYYNGSYTYTSVADKLTSGVKGIYANSTAFAALKIDGSVVTWGDAKAGGDASIVTNNKGFSYESVADKLVAVSAIYATDTAFAALKKNGTVVTWGSADAGGNSLGVSSQLVKVKQIVASKQDFAALKADGSLVVWGGSFTGDMTSLHALLINIKQVYANDSAFAALKKNGTVITFGSANDGGNSSLVSAELVNVKEIFATKSAFAAFKTDGSVVTWGNSKTGGDSSGLDLTNIKTLYANQHAFAALKQDGSVVTWGDTFYGGDSSAVADKLTGVKAIYHTDTAFAAVKFDGSVVTWGNLAGGGDSSAVVNQLHNVIEIYATGNDTSSAFAAVKADGSVVTWGDAYYGGNASSVASQLNGAIDVIKFNDEASLSNMGSATYGKIITIFDEDTNLGLYATSTGKYILSGKGLAFGAMPTLSLELKDKTGKKDWLPAAGEFIVAIDENADSTDVIISKFSATLGISYSQWTFSNSTGFATDTKAKPIILADILLKESELAQDINGDAAIGNVITQVLVSNDSLGLYKMASGVYIISDKGQEVGDQPSFMTELKLNKTSKWSPTVNDNVIALEPIANGLELVVATSSKTKTTYTKQGFDLNTGIALKKTTPTGMQLSLYEEAQGVDLNKDGFIASMRVQMGDSVYDLILTPEAWTTAKMNAEKATYFDPDSNMTIKGSLVSINTQAEQNNLMEFITPFLSKLTAKAADGGNVPYFWTSGSDSVKETIWLWSDKTSIDLTSSHWNEKPETYATNRQDYLGVALADSADGAVLAGQWNDLIGTNKLPYIIEYSLA